jgi:hypothetical protein
MACVPLPCRICGCDASVSGGTQTVSRPSLSFTSFVSGPCILSRSQYLPPASPSVVGYFYIDFGPSIRFPKGRDTTPGDTPKAFETIPELSDTVPYNPLKGNISQLGLTMANVIKVCFRPHSVWIVQLRPEFHHEYHALCAFSPVANRRMTPDPAERPEPAQSLAEFNHIVARTSAKRLRAPILCGIMGRLLTLPRTWRAFSVRTTLQRGGTRALGAHLQGDFPPPPHLRPTRLLICILYLLLQFNSSLGTTGLKCGQV